MLTILRFIIQFGIKKAIKKFGKKKVTEATKKVVPKTKPVKHKTELERVRKSAAENLKKFQAKLFGKAKPEVKPKGKITGYTIRNFRGKKEPVFGKPKLVKGSARWDAEQKKIKDGIAYLNATRGPGHTLKDLKRIIAQTKKRLAMKKKPKKP